MKKVAVLLAIVLFLFAGITAVCFMAKNVPVTYDGSTMDVTELMADYEKTESAAAPDAKSDDERTLPENPDGVASIIVSTDLSETEAVNNVAAVVFDYRGYDTMGESFILLTAIAGSFIILKTVKGRKEEPDDEE